MSGLIEVARWWRTRQRQEPRLAARMMPTDVQFAKPRTQLLHVARSAEGRRFMQSRVKELEACLQDYVSVRDARSNGALEASEIRANLGSLLHLLGELDRAETHLRRASDLDGTGRFECQLERVRRERAAKQVLQAALRARLQDPAAMRGVLEEIDRVDAANLSKRDFIDRYARPGVPVIITGLVDGMFSKGVWTWARLKDELGNKTFVPRQRVQQSPDWASLEDAPAVTVAAFIDAMRSEGGHQMTADATAHNIAHPAHRSTYLFDWNLPDNAPHLCSELNIPIYFADDLLQRLPEGTMYRDAWPSLFVGPRGTRSGLHVDAFGRYVRASMPVMEVEVASDLVRSLCVSSNACQGGLGCALARVTLVGRVCALHRIEQTQQHINTGIKIDRETKPRH
jgi:hypothetical protein